MSAASRASRLDSTKAERAAWIVGVVGALLFAFAAYADAANACRSYLFVWWFLLGIPLGSMVMLMTHNMTGGGWGEAIRPALDAALRLLPLSLILVVPLLFGLHALYAWSRPDVLASDPLLRAKTWYLSVDYFVLRNAAYFVAWLVLAHLLRKWAFARGPQATLAQAQRLRAISAIGMLVYALTVTLAAVDWIMSLMPHWYSTTFGFLTGIGQAMAAFSFAIVCTAWRVDAGANGDTLLSEESALGVRSDAYGNPVPAAETSGPVASGGARTRDLFQDLGNLLLMFVMTWAYLAFTQYLIIWAEDLPNEIAWYLPRVNTSWHDVALFLVAFHFAVPLLVLLSRRAKRVPRALGALAAMLLFAHLVDTYWLVVPAFRLEGVAIAWSDVPAIAALGGIWLAAYLRTSRRTRAPFVVSEARSG
jgi:hypothetical protein